MIHQPVLQKEVLEYLDPKPNDNFIDCTVGQGGHAVLILERTGPNGKLIGIDADKEQIDNCRNRLGNLFKERLILVNDSYANLKNIAEGFKNIKGILFDLGMSSWHLEESKRGFSFLKDEELKMTYNSSSNNAGHILNNYSEREIEKILREYGEERYSKRIARNIVENRPIKTTFQLNEIIERIVPRQKIHKSTRTFQALRIAANNELDNLKKALPVAAEIIDKGGRIGVISFHSLEDRIVKDFFKTLDNFKIITKKPITANKEEINNNLRSRSAKLRVIEKI